MSFFSMGTSAVKFIIATCFISALAFAETDGFFENDFAKGPVSGTKEISTAFMEDKKPQPEQKPEAMKAVPVKNVAAPTEEPIIEEKSDASTLNILPRGKKVKAVGLIVNAVNAKHFDDSLRELVEVLKKHEFDAGSIYALGNFQSQGDMSTVMKIIARGGDLEVTWSIPDEYPVTKSPTWILRTEEGEILLEGVPSLDSYISGNGEFIDKSASIAGDLSPEIEAPEPLF